MENILLKLEHTAIDIHVRCYEILGKTYYSLISDISVHNSQVNIGKYRPTSTDFTDSKQPSDLGDINRGIDDTSEESENNLSINDVLKRAVNRATRRGVLSEAASGSPTSIGAPNPTAEHDVTTHPLSDIAASQHQVLDNLSASTSVSSKRTDVVSVPTPQAPVVTIDRSYPNYDVLVRESIRLSTFHDWPTWANVSPSELAKQGFFYTGESDRVQCVFCRSHLRNWAVGDIPYTEHRKTFPDCALLQGLDVNNINDISGPTSLQSQVSGVSQSYQGAGESPELLSKSSRSTPSLVPITPLAAVSSSQMAGVTVDRFNPDYVILSRERVRLSTFHDWPASAKVGPSDLAREGFFYTGEADRVQCVFCRNHLRNWDACDVPSSEHKRKYSDCPFVRGLDVQNVNDVSDPHSAQSKTQSMVPVYQGGGIPATNTNTSLGFPHPVSTTIFSTSLSSAPAIRAASLNLAPIKVDRSNPDYNVLVRESVRLLTFHDWPSSANVKPFELASHGFFYTGGADRVQCVFCLNHLRNWAVGDVPSYGHKKTYPDCPFVRGINVNNVNDVSDPTYIQTDNPRGTESHESESSQPSQNLREEGHFQHQSVLSKPETGGNAKQLTLTKRELAARMDTPMVQTLMRMGYRRESISTVLQQRMKTTGDDFTSMKDLLEAVLELEDSASTLSGPVA